MSSVCSAFSRPARCLDEAARGPLRRAALRLSLLAALAVSGPLASCQPLPHPFADDRPPAELLAVPESAGISIAPIAGEPSAIAARLGAATARALVDREIAASDKTNLRGSYRLYGDITASRPRGGQSSVAVRWRLHDAAGREIGVREVRIEGTAEDWQSAAGAMIDRLAGLSAEAVAPLLAGPPADAKHAALATAVPDPAKPEPAPQGPPSAAPPFAKPPPLLSAPNPAATPESGRPRVAVRGVTGAPGDGATALARAVTSVLRQQDLTIVEPDGKPDFIIDGDVAITPAGSDKQHVKIVWRVRDAHGAERGTVGQENDVPRGLLNGSWGDVAYAVAVAAGDGLSQVFARTAPPANADARSSAATGAASADRRAPNAQPGQPDRGGASQPAASRVKAANTGEQR